MEEVNQLKEKLQQVYDQHLDDYTDYCTMQNIKSCEVVLELLKKGGKKC